MVSHQTSSPDRETPVASRRTILKGAFGTAVLAMLAGCGDLGNRSVETPQTPEQRVQRDFQTYLRQVANGILGKLEEPASATEEPAPYEARGVNNPDAYYWNKVAHTVPGSKPFELGVTITYTEYVADRPDGYTVEFTISGSTMPDGSGRSVHVELQPSAEQAQFIAAQCQLDASVLDIASAVMSDGGGRLETFIFYKPDPQTTQFGPLPNASTKAFDESATLEQKRTILNNYERELSVMRRIADF